jgi:hypothetical protein
MYISCNLIDTSCNEMDGGVVYWSAMCHIHFLYKVGTLSCEMKKWLKKDEEIDGYFLWKK